MLDFVQIHLSHHFRLGNLASILSLKKRSYNLFTFLLNSDIEIWSIG